MYKMKKNLNQKLIHLIEYYQLINADILFANSPINRNVKKERTLDNSSKKKKLEKLKHSIKNIKNCELKKNANNLVFSDGNINSKIMIIGEGPGAQEDLEGIPFVGRAGKLLDKMLEAINLNRNKVYISNVVNYRPPSNRKPNDEEINRYFPYLQSHIEIINPKILLLLGATALKTIMGDDETISKARGRWLEKNIGLAKPWIMASFHPAFLMRQPDQKKLSWLDLKMIREKIKKLNL